MSYTFAIGDIHGCMDQLRCLLAQVEAYADQGRVVFLGDYVDRGPDSNEVLNMLIAGAPCGWEWICLKGNHEDMMTGALRGLSDLMWWIGNGGNATIHSFGGEVPEYAIRWCESLPSSFEDDHRIFVHAGAEEDKPVSEQSDEILLWRRVPSHYSGNFGGKHLVHGHTPSSSNPKTVGNRTNIDAGCVFGGPLVCAVFDDQVSGGPIDFIEVRA